MQEFSIVIATRNRAGALEALLRELLAFQPAVGEIIVVDNDSMDATAAVAQKFDVKYFYFPGGLAEARHLGSAAAKGKWISYVDDDSLPANREVFTEIAGAFEENPEAGIVGCRIENIGFRDMQKFKGYCRFGPNAILEFEPDPRQADVFASMAITIRKDVYDKIGGFDPVFSRGCEEVDLCMKVKRAGFKLVYQPAAAFNHYQMGSEFRFNPVHNRDYMRLYSCFKFFKPSGPRGWTLFSRSEWKLFWSDVKQIRKQYLENNFHSTHLKRLNRFLDRHPYFRGVVRWPITAGAIVVSPVLRRLFIPYIYWQAQRRRKYEATHFNLRYA